MRIGIFGGSFNPPHNMHKNMAISLVEKGYLDSVIYVPVGNLYNKPYLASDTDRYNMLKLMVEGYDYLTVSDYEFGQLTYTYQTLTHFKEQYPEDEIYFICGSDNLRQFTTWREYEYILSNFKLLIIGRNNDSKDELKNCYKQYYKNIIFTDIQESPLSSTEIRRRIKENDSQGLENEIDRKVYQYITNKKLYK